VIGAWYVDWELNNKVQGEGGYDKKELVWRVARE